MSISVYVFECAWATLQWNQITSPWMNEVVHFLSSLEYYSGDRISMCICFVNWILPSGRHSDIGILVSHNCSLDCSLLHSNKRHRLFEWINNMYCTGNKFIDLIALYAFFCVPVFILFYLVCLFLCNDAQNSPYSLFYWTNNTDTQHFLIQEINKSDRGLSIQNRPKIMVSVLVQSTFR